MSAADSPWIKWWTDDFLMGVVDLAADEIGVYTVLLNLMASRGGPIPDDRRWLARRCGSTTRRFNQIIDHLTALGKLQHRDGLIGNRRMIEELEARRAKSSKARGSAMARWHADQDELPLETGTDSRAHGTPAPAPESKIISGKNEDNLEIISPKKSQKPRQSANSANANASGLAGARVRSSEDSEESSTHPNGLPPCAPAREAPDPPGRLGNADLKTLYDAVCEAAGFATASPAAIDRAYTHIEKWRDEGFDFDEVVIPAIRAEVLQTDEPTRTLGRFNKRIRHEAARHAASKAKAQPYRAPQVPKLNPEGEDPKFLPLRTDLLDKLGDATYCLAFNPITFREGEQGDKRILVVNGRDYETDRLRHGRFKALLLASAQPYGFADVW
jgi:uncharacterized protein YdaU (DUF1376 family)